MIREFPYNSVFLLFFILNFTLRSIGAVLTSLEISAKFSVLEYDELVDISLFKYKYLAHLKSHCK